jgi:hypothetical protein
VVVDVQWDWPLPLQHQQYSVNQLVVLARIEHVAPEHHSARTQPAAFSVQPVQVYGVNEASARMVTRESKAKADPKSNTVIQVGYYVRESARSGSPSERGKHQKNTEVQLTVLQQVDKPSP